MSSITLGFGNRQRPDSTDFVALYRDTNASGVYDTGDTLYGTAGAFSGDNGTRTFSASVAIAGAATETFFVVVTMNGSTPASSGQTFKTRVSAFSSSVASDSLGVPTAIMEGVTAVNLTFTMTDNSPASAANVTAGSTNNVIQNFTATLSGSASVDLLTLTVRHAGTGDPIAGYAQVRLWLDDGDGNFSSSTDTVVNTGTPAFSGSPASCTFTLTAGAAAFAAAQTKRFFVVVDFNASPTFGQTFKSFVSAGTTNPSGVPFNTLPLPSASGTAGL